MISLAKCVLLVSSIIAVGQACIATTTTTTVCCSVLNTSTLPRTTPSISTQEQCSILRRISSTCPSTGTILCDAADDTNPTSVLIQFFNAAGSVVDSVSATGTSASATLTCTKGVWYYGSDVVAQVSCSQSGSTGADRGNTSG